MSDKEIEERFKYLNKYLSIRIDLNNFNDSWFFGFEESFKNRFSRAYSIFFPRYRDVKRLDNVNDKNDHCEGNIIAFRYFSGYYVKGGKMFVSDWQINPNYDVKFLEKPNEHISKNIFVKSDAIEESKKETLLEVLKRNDKESWL